MSIAESVLWAGVKALRTERKQSARDGEEKFGERFLSVCWLGNGYNFLHKLREFGIKNNRYVNCHVAQAGEITIRFLSNLAQESIVSYPEFTFRCEFKIRNPHF